MDAQLPRTARLVRMALPDHVCPWGLRARHLLRSHGYAFDKGEHFDGISCVAAPILDQHGLAIGAVTIAGPSSRFPAATMVERGQFIREQADRIARAFLS